MHWGSCRLVHQDRYSEGNGKKYYHCKYKSTIVSKMRAIHAASHIPYGNVPVAINTCAVRDSTAYVTQCESMTMACTPTLRRSLLVTYAHNPRVAEVVRSTFQRAQQ